MGVRKNKGNRVSEAEMEIQEVIQETKEKLGEKRKGMSPWEGKKYYSNLRRLKAVYEGRWKVGQQLPDGWKMDGFTMPKGSGKNKEQEVPKMKPKTETQVERVMKKMKQRIA